VEGSCEHGNETSRLVHEALQNVRELRIYPELLVDDAPISSTQNWENCNRPVALDTVGVFALFQLEYWSIFPPVW
jgi:hypothetical protein